MPDRGYSAVPQAQVGPFAPMATPNVQLGTFVIPYGVPTQLPGIYPGIQLYCGVEAINTDWMVPSAGDVPYFQATPRSMPLVTTRDGGAPGATFGPAEMSDTYGAIRQQRAQDAQTFAAGLLGW